MIYIKSSPSEPNNELYIIYALYAKVNSDFKIKADVIISQIYKFNLQPVI